MNLTTLNKICLVGFVVCLVANIAWLSCDLYLGGSARYGSRVNGIYKVKANGKKTVVSEQWWNTSLTLNSIARITIPLLFVMFWLSGIDKLCKQHNRNRLSFETNSTSSANRRFLGK